MCKVNRWYWRCLDCCAVVATELNPQRTAFWEGRKIGLETDRLDCACGGHMKLLGRVQQDTLVSTEMRCACDSRCTDAPGPNCECSCGGANHGKNKVVMVEVVSGIPVAQGANMQAAEEFRAAKKAAQERITKLPSFEDYKAGVFIARGAWDLIRKEKSNYVKACNYATHMRRMAALAKVAE